MSTVTKTTSNEYHVRRSLMAVQDRSACIAFDEAWYASALPRTRLLYNEHYKSGQYHGSRDGCVRALVIAEAVSNSPLFPWYTTGRWDRSSPPKVRPNMVLQPNAADQYHLRFIQYAHRAR